MAMQMDTAFTKNLDLNKLVKKLLKQHWAKILAHWASFCSPLGAIL